MTADRAYGSPPQGGDPEDSRLVRLQDVYPYSTPNNYLATPDGSWVFIGEGGSLAFADMRGIDVDSYLSGNGQLEQSLDDLDLIVKRAPIGAHGVVASSMVLDPEADLSDDVPGGTHGSEDADDLAYVAGGNLGLWLMRMHPGATYENEAARIDDSGNLQPGSQHSKRFCTDVEIVTVGDKDYLVALFAKKEGSRMRFYDLDRVRPIAGGPELGGEIAADHQVVVNDHPQEPDVLEPPLHGRSLALAMAVDPFTDLNQNAAADIYVAMNTNGLVRIRVTDPNGTGLVTDRQWGPWFGDESIHVDDDASTPAGLNSSGYPIERYSDVAFKDMDRHDGTGDVTRRDPPAFVEVAVQDDGPGEHYLYAAVDSLGWVRFDLEDTFDPSMPIDYHEGEQVDPDDFGYGGVGVIWDQPFMRPLDHPSSSGEDILYCRNVKLAHVDDGAGGTKTVLLAFYGGAPWAFFAQNVGPGVQFDQDFAKVSDIGLYALTQTSSPAQVLTFHETTSIPSGGAASTTTFAGYLQVGGGDLFVPEIQTAANNGRANVLRLVHGTFTSQSTTMTGFGQFLAHQSCVSFFDLAPPVVQGNPVTEPYYLREPGQAPGRYHFGAVASVIDPYLLVTAHNDSANPQEGVLQISTTLANPSGPDEYELAPTDGDFSDRRFDSGILCEPESQWADVDADMDDVLVTMGGASGSSWRIAEDEYTLTPTVTVTADRRWTLGQPLDRWRRTVSGDYWGAAADADYDAYTIANRGASANVLAHTEGPDTWVLGYRLRTCDGIQFIGRDGHDDGVIDIDMLMEDVRGAPSGSLVPFKDMRESLTGENPWWSFQLDTDPSWANFEEDEQNADEWGKAQLWWDPDPDLHPFTLWKSARRCFAPEFFELRSSQGGERDLWVLAVACGHATCPPNVHEYSDGMTQPADLGLPNIPASFDPSPPWDTHHDHGFCLVWDVSDPWQLRADAEAQLPAAQQRPIRTDRDALILPNHGGTAFRLDHVYVPSPIDKDLLFVADMIGHVYCFDVTDLMYTTSGTGYRDPIAEWKAPLSTWDDRPNNVRALAVEVLSNGVVMCYVGVSRVGLVSVPFVGGTTFKTDEEFKVKTPGEVWGLDITGSGDDRVLIVSDAWAGMRIYGIDDIPGAGE